MQYEGHNPGVTHNPVDLEWNATCRLTVLSVFRTAVSRGEVKTIAIQSAPWLVRNQSEVFLSSDYLFWAPFGENFILNLRHNTVN